MKAAFVWTVAGDRYEQEAVRSADSAREVMPDVDRVLITDIPTNRPVFTQVEVAPLIRRDGPQYWYLTSVSWWVHALTLGYDKLIFMDCDTRICKPLDDVLDILGRFDLAGTLTQARVTGASEVSPAFCELNIGMMGILNNLTMQAFFGSWLGRMMSDPERYGHNDQVALREMLWEHPEVKVAVLPSEYNCRFGAGIFAYYPVKVLHGRAPMKGLKQIEREINAHAGSRLWDKERGLSWPDEWRSVT